MMDVSISVGVDVDPALRLDNGSLFYIFHLELDAFVFVLVREGRRDFVIFRVSETNAAFDFLSFLFCRCFDAFGIDLFLRGAGGFGTLD